MSGPRPSPDDRAPVTLAHVLEQLGAELDAALDLPGGAVRDAAIEHARVVQHRLDAVVARGAPLAAADARRVDALRRRLALVARADRGADIVAEVTARLPRPGSAEWRRAVLAEAFLEAPASLTRWRRAAMAAAVLAAVGITLARTSDEGLTSRGASGPDPRVGLLEPLEPTGDSLTPAWLRSGRVDGPTRNVDWPGLGVPGSGWQPVPRLSADPWGGRAVRVLPLRIRSARAYERVVDPFFGAPRPSDEPQAPVERN